MGEWWCWIGPYNAHCFETESGQSVQPDGSCYFCGAPDPDGTFASAADMRNTA